MNPLLRTLGILSVLELASLAALLADLVTVHDDAVSAAAGPLHGAFYLAVATTGLLGRGLWPPERESVPCFPCSAVR